MNNNISNLRWATYKEQNNNMYRPIIRNNINPNTIGHKYIRISSSGKYRFCIHNRNISYSKTYNTLEEAIIARDEYINQMMI